jgi:hypothetical protein
MHGTRMRAHGHISFKPREKRFLDTQLRRSLNIKAHLMIIASRRYKPFAFCAD